MMVSGFAHLLEMTLYEKLRRQRLTFLFPASSQGERILRIKSLTEEVETAKGILASVKPTILFPAVY